MNTQRQVIEAAISGLPGDQIVSVAALHLAQAFGDDVASGLAARKVRAKDEQAKFDAKKQSDIAALRRDRKVLQNRMSLGFDHKPSELNTINTMIENAILGRSVIVGMTPVSVASLRAAIAANPEPTDAENGEDESESVEA